MRDQPNPSIVVLGAGAIGRALTARLIKASFPVSLISRHGIIHAPIRLDTDRGVIRVEPSREPTTDAEAIRRSNIIFSCVKAFDVERALDTISQHATNPTRVVICSNGFLSDRLPTWRARHASLIFRRGLITFGVTRTRDDALKLVGATGRLTLGAWGENTARDRVEETLLHELPDFLAWTDDIIPLERRKWLFNTTLNTVCARHRLRQNKEAREFDAELRALFDRSYDFGAQTWGPWDKSPEDLWKDLLSLIRETAENENSMAADVRAGRETEAAFLEGILTRPR
jgi:2-dehydropantoate 2-reductase